MNLDQVTRVEELHAFLTGSQAMAFAVTSNKEERYQFVASTLKRFHYKQLPRSEKGVVIQFLIKMTGHSRQQLTRMIQSHQERGYLKRHQNRRMIELHFKYLLTFMPLFMFNAQYFNHITP